MTKISYDVSGERSIRGGEFILDQPDDEMIWGAGPKVVWAPGEPLLMTALTGVGKSSLTGRLLLTRIGILSDPLLNLPVEPLPPDDQVLYLAMDRQRQIARNFRRMVTERDREVLDERLVVWRGPVPFINVLKDPYALADWVEESYPYVRDVYIDSLKDLAIGLTNDDVGAAVNAAQQELCARGKEVVALHHHRKPRTGNENPNTLADVYGSVWITAGAGSVVHLDGEAGATNLKFRQLKPVNETVGPFDLRHDKATGLITVHDVVTDILAFVIAQGELGATEEEVAEACYGNAEVKTIRKAHRRLAKLKGQGLEFTPGRKGGSSGGTVAGRWHGSDERKRRTHPSRNSDERKRQTPTNAATTH